MQLVLTTYSCASPCRQLKLCKVLALSQGCSLVAQLQRFPCHSPLWHMAQLRCLVREHLWLCGGVMWGLLACRGQHLCPVGPGLQLCKPHGAASCSSASHQGASSMVQRGM